MNVICSKCGEVNNYSTVMKGVHKMAYCNSCDSFIKNIAYQKPALYFGKFKGRLIEDFTTIEDASYLNWLLTSNVKLSANIKTAIKKQLNIK